MSSRNVTRHRAGIRSNASTKTTMSERGKRQTLEALAKWATVVATLAGLLWGVVSTLETWSRESRRPFLDRQLTLYEEATRTAAVLATSEDPTEVEAAEERFWQLYWGELALVENGGLGAQGGGVEAAMVRFGNALRARPRNMEILQQRSLDLAHACRDSLADSWGVPSWKSPQYSRDGDD